MTSLSGFGLLRWVITYLDFCYNATSFGITVSCVEKCFEHSFQICKNEGSAKNAPL